MIAFAAALVAWMSGWIVGFVLLIAFTAFVAFFFRNPNRNVPTEMGLVVAPADGRIVAVEEGSSIPTDREKNDQGKYIHVRIECSHQSFPNCC